MFIPAYVEINGVFRLKQLISEMLQWWNKRAMTNVGLSCSKQTFVAIQIYIDNKSFFPSSPQGA